MEPASQSAGLIHYERLPSGTSYQSDGPLSVCVCVCERERKGKRSLTSSFTSIQAKIDWIIHMHLRAFTYTRWNEDHGFHILLKFSTHITSCCEPSSSFWVDCNCLKSIKYGGKGGTWQKKKIVGGGKRFSHCGRKEQFENWERAHTITCSRLACCWKGKTEDIIIKKGRRREGVSVYVEYSP